MVYAMAWRPWHDIWYGLAAIALYMLWPGGHHMVWPGEVCHGMWKVIELHA